MRVFIVVNRVQEIGFRQTTALLIAAFHRQDHDVYLVNVEGLSWGSLPGSAIRSRQTFFAHAIPLQLPFEEHTTSTHVADFANEIQDFQFTPVEIRHQDLILIRTNPGRDLERTPQHTAFLELCQVAQSVGIRVVNDPTRLAFLSSKAAIALLPEKFRPDMLVTRNFESVVTFVREAGCECVVKPLLGSRGNNVVRINARSHASLKNLKETFRNQNVVVQHFINSNEPGDKRVVVLKGRLIEWNEHLAGIQRVPADGDFRANIHAGATARSLSLSEQEREAVLAAGSILCQKGIQLAGIDLIGTKVIEFNVFSTGGLFDANRIAGYDFTDTIVQSLT